LSDKTLGVRTRREGILIDAESTNVGVGAHEVEAAKKLSPSSRDSGDRLE